MKKEENMLLEEMNYQENELCKFSVSFIMPRKELVKLREKKSDVFVQFPLWEYQILPDYKNNRIELAKLIDLIKEINEDDDADIVEIKLDSYTCPNGSYILNKELSTKRAYGLKRYIQFIYGFDNNLFSVRGMSDDWGTIERLLLDPNTKIEGKEEALSVIWNTDIYEGREKSLKNIRNGELFEQIEKDIYPLVRRYSCSVIYTIRPFDVEKGKKMLRKQPEQLSVDELYQIARTYKSYTPKYNEIINMAVRLNPENEIANLNAAALALKFKNVSSAKKYLDRCNTETPEFLNNMGILHVLCGEYNKAWNIFNKSIKKGSNDGELNILMLEREKIYK
ncbi:MAG: hypothetical protein LBH90_08595 [Tannerella sp.]|nr:hypothetical protein [Tannerella sp.]